MPTSPRRPCASPGASAIEPRVALLAYSTFGHPRGERSDKVREAVDILNKRQVDFEFDGDMAADVALNRDAMKLYPFCRLSDTANVLIMPAFHSASISTKMLKELGGATLIGPMLVGMTHSVQICQLGAKDSDLSTWRRWRPTTSTVEPGFARRRASRVRGPCRPGSVNFHPSSRPR